MLHRLMSSGPDQPCIHHIAEYRAAALLTNRMRSNRVPLRSLELLVSHRFASQPLELGQQSVAGNVFLFRGCCDVRHEHSRELMLAAECVNSVRERLPVAQLIEESSAESASDSRDDARD